MLNIDLNHVCACQLYTITHKSFWTLWMMCAIKITIFFSEMPLLRSNALKTFFERYLLHFFLREY